MIPKIIHLCWLSGDDFPEVIQQCLITWREHLSDYDIWLWGKLPKDVSCLKGLRLTEKSFDINSIDWTREAFIAKKYAFAADYIRLYALYKYGGIYLDSDVIVYKSFNSLLSRPYFIGQDQIRAFEAAIIGSSKGCRWIKDILDSYDDRHFVKEDGTYDVLPLPCRFSHVLTSLDYRFYKTEENEEYNEKEKEIRVFHKDFFNSRNAIEVQRTKRSFCAHNYAYTWGNKKTGLSIKFFLPRSILKLIYILGQITWAKNKYAWFQIKFEN